MSNETKHDMSAEEIWKDIEGYEGIYKISSLGNVKTLSRHYYNGEYGNVKMFMEEKIRTPIKHPSGYLTMILCKNGVKKRYTIHRIVALNFIPNPDNKRCVNHIDGKKDNNAVSNLEWCTHKENNSHAIENKLRRFAHNRWNGSLIEIK